MFMSQIQSREAHQKKELEREERKREKRTEREGEGRGGGRELPHRREKERKQNKASSVCDVFFYPVLTSIYFDIRAPLLKLIEHLLFLIAGNQQLKQAAG